MMSERQFLTIKLWILGSLSGIMIAIISWFIVRYDRVLDDNMKDLKGFNASQRQINEQILTILEQHNGVYNLLNEKLLNQDKAIEELKHTIEEQGKQINQILYSK